MAENASVSRKLFRSGYISHSKHQTDGAIFGTRFSKQYTFKKKEERMQRKKGEELGTALTEDYITNVPLLL